MAKKRKKIPPTGKTTPKKVVKRAGKPSSQKPSSKRADASAKSTGKKKLPEKKKGKRGRPKKIVPPPKPKRGRKPKIKEPEHKTRKGAGFSSNNFNSIRALLWRNHKADFKGYFDPDFIRIVQEIYNDCKALGVTCTDDVILEKYGELQTDDKRPQPIIDAELLEPQIYFQIKDVQFAEFEPYLWIVSPMIIAPPSEFRVTSYYTKTGDTTKGYNRYFREWVDWCNHATREQFGSEGGTDEIEIYFRFMPVEYNAALKRWQTEIVICTPSGQVFDFGFKPTGGGFDEHELDEEYIEPTPEQLEQAPTTEEQRKQTEELQKRRKNVELKNQLESLQEKLRKKLKKEKEREIKHKLEIQIAKDKEFNRLSREYNKQFKLLKVYEKVKDKKMVKKILKELNKITKLMKKLR